MGILLYNNNKTFYVSYKIWNKIKTYLGISSLKYLNKSDTNHSKGFYETINYLLQTQYTIFFLNSLLSFYENNLQNVIMTQLQGIFLFIKQNNSSYLYNYQESISFINSIDTIKTELTNDTVLNNYIHNIYNIHKYGIENNSPVYIN